MKHEVPDWLAEAIALIGAFILFVTQAKRIWGWLRILWAWWQRRANAISDLATHVRIYVRWMELFGWGYWAYYPATNRLIWTRKQCQIYGMLCEKSVRVDGYEMFNRVVLDDGFRERARHAVEMSQKTRADFRQQFPARNQVTQEIIFIEARGKWVFDKHGQPYCLHGFNRRIDFGDKEFQQKLDQLTLCRIISEWRREGAIPESIVHNGSPRS